MSPNQKQQQQVLVENEDAERLPSFQKKGYRTMPLFYVNGARVPDAKALQALPSMTLLTFLRTVLRLTGSKLGCAEGGCGACTVMISRLVVEDHSGKDSSSSSSPPQIQHYSVNACLMPALAADGCHVTTVEGIGTVRGGKLHPIQQAMVDMHGSQCGFCTPGIIVSIYTLLSNNPHTKHVEEHLDGNLCRCTGYRPIWDAARSLCVDGADLVKGPCGTPCRECPERDDCEQECNVQDKQQQQQDGDDKGCCSTSSLDKMKAYKDSFLKDTAWRNQANDMFPAELVTLMKETPQLAPLVVVDRTAKAGGGSGTWFQPTSLVDLLSLLREFGSAGCKLVVGNTEVGIEVRFKREHYPRLIAPSHAIAELFAPPTIDESVIKIGSCCPLSTVQQTCQDLAKAHNHVSVTRTCDPIYDMLRWFASTQIRNVACLGGNLVTASPISDMNPLLDSMGATLVLSSLEDGGGIRRRTCAVSDFFVSYRKTELKTEEEVVERIEIPLVRPVFEYVFPFKQARRREDDISIVTSGMKLRLAVETGKYVISHAALAFGGMAPKTVLAVKTGKFLVGQEFCAATFDEASAVLLDELSLPEGVPGGQAAYRMTLTTSFLRQFYLSCLQELHKDVQSIQQRLVDDETMAQYALPLPESPVLTEAERSGIANFLSEEKPSFSGVQTYPVPKVLAKGVEETQLKPVAEPLAETEPTVGKAVTHQSGPLHCTGEALYVDDIPEPDGTLHASLVLANECGRVLQSIDGDMALATPGVVGVYTHEHLVALGGNNAMGPIVYDEFVFLPVGEVVRTVGQVLGIVVADTLANAEMGARLVKVKYEDPPEQKKIIVSIQDAIEASSFYEFSRHSLERGDVTALEALLQTQDSPIAAESPAVGDIVKVSGNFYSGAQEHFYLETNGTIVVPSEADTNLTVYCSSQAPGKTQTFCAAATGTPASKVVVRVKRMGGGFGGKETRSVFASVATAVAAKTLVRPVKCILPRDTDMKITGTRHVFFSRYHASAQITENGAKLVSLDIELYNNGGSAFDLSGPVMDRALFHVDGCYNFTNFRCKGVVCKTVQPPHTAFRGFGGPQGMAAVENVMEHLAAACCVPIDVLRRSNMYKNGDVVPFGMIIGEEDSGKWNVPLMWDRMEKELKIADRRELISDFNAKHLFKKRGLSFLPTKFGIAYTAKLMNQGGALVHVYSSDGTVLVSHGGTEMGQGLDTKVCQVAAQAFGIPITDVYVNDNTTDKVANSIPTAASMSTDMYGMATLDACRQILARLEPIRKELGPGASLKDIAQKAFFNRIDLSAHGFFSLHDERCGFDWDAERPVDFPETKPWNSWKGHPFNYFTQGVACTEVEVDLLTGNHRTLRSDVMVDVGSSINPAIDIGQIEGAFTQGMGWSTIEDVVYGDDDHTWIRIRGSVFTTGPGTYKIPAFNDVPEVFNVTLLENADNPYAVHSSKAIGEPPFYLGASVYNAIKDAVGAARQQHGHGTAHFEMRMPATSERIRMYVADNLSTAAVDKQAGSGSMQKTASTFQPQGSY